MWEHLKRLGLEQYACAFESYGFFSKNSCVAGGALPVAEIDKWCKEATPALIAPSRSSNAAISSARRRCS